ncbi:MAG: two-component system, OmpR family, sensor histidine kinase SenX3 [Pseudonocardiales bacterium]|jgi:two-component system sensor histidine kinase SenX3|nr:two-component system, OmpR family, sensor histidine kinase SenX3 [Pseudonocardiales bacterium]
MLVVALLGFLAGMLLAGLTMAAMAVMRRRAAPARSGQPAVRSDVDWPAGDSAAERRAPDLSSTPAAAHSLAPRVLSAIDVGVVVVDRAEAAIFANRAARQIRVVERDRLTMPALLELVRSVTDSGEPESRTMDLASPKVGPELFSYLVSAMPLDDGGRVTTVLLTFSDITETRRLERVRRDFVANVSHELKTPVGALTLLAEAVQEASDDPEAVQRFSRRMQREGARLGRLVQELIELSRLQGAEPLPGQQLVAVSQVLSEAVDRSRLLAEQSGITVVVRSEPGLQARGNETQLATAIANLVDNAIAYSPERTKVGVSSRAVVDPSGAEWIDIAVTDQGIGIAEPDLDRVFERFFRVDPARSRATGGTGLGLAIVKHIATNHGGAVSVWSVYGSGSTFTIKLPLAGRQAGDDHAEAAVAADASELPARVPAPEPSVVMASDSVPGRRPDRRPDQRPDHPQADAQSIHSA